MQLNTHSLQTPHTTPVCQVDFLLKICSLQTQAEISPNDITMTSSDFIFRDLTNLLQSIEVHYATVFTCQILLELFGHLLKFVFSVPVCQCASVHVCVTQVNQMIATLPCKPGNVLLAKCMTCWSVECTSTKVTSIELPGLNMQRLPILLWYK